MKFLLKVPILNDQIKKKVCEEMIKGFGGNFYAVSYTHLTLPTIYSV